MDHFIPLSIPNFEGNEAKYVNKAIEEAWVSTGGAYITQLEHNLAKFLHVDNVAACQSGTAALHLCLVEAGVKPGDAVIVPPLSFIASVNPVRYQFAEPIFIDVDDSLCIDPIKLEEFCKKECEQKDGKLYFNGRHIKALIAVHVFGNMADMEAIIDIAHKYNITVIEDAAEALGTKYTEGRYKGKYAGTIGDLGAYSFNGNKVITTGGGGAITARDPKVVDHLRFLSTQAKTDPHYYIHDEVGFNYRMTNLQAALGVAQMEELPEFLERKRRNYDYYVKLFEGFELGYIVPYRDGTESCKWLYSLAIDRNKIRASMRQIITELEERKIQTRAIWGLIHEQKPYRDCYTYIIEKAKHYSDCVLNLPSSTNITKEDIEHVAEQVKDVLKEFAN